MGDGWTEMKQSPTKRSLAELRKTCSAVEVVEHWNPFARIRKDLFGFIDILALCDGETIAVQSTSWSNVSARVKKIAESEHLAAVRKAGWRIEVHGWKKGKDGKYVCRVEDLS